MWSFSINVWEPSYANSIIDEMIDTFLLRVRIVLTHNVNACMKSDCILRHMPAHNFLRTWSQARQFLISSRMCTWYWRDLGPFTPHANLKIWFKKFLSHWHIILHPDRWCLLHVLRRFFSPFFAPSRGKLSQWNWKTIYRSLELFTQ